MKTFIKIFGLLLVMGGVFTFTSCGDDEESGEREVITPKSYVYKIPIAKDTIRAGQLASETVYLDLVSLVGEEIANNLVPGKSVYPENTLNASNKNFIRVANLVHSTSKKILLEDFTITVGNQSPLNLGTFVKDTANLRPYPSSYVFAEKVNPLDTIPTTYGTGNVTFAKALKPVFDGQLAAADGKVKVTISFKPTVDIVAADKIEISISISGTYTYMLKKYPGSFM
ncbi:hypothetical protein [Viscerimonas tarda]